MVYILFFFFFSLSLSSKCSLFHNSNVFGSRIIRILYIGCAKIKKNNNSGAKRLITHLHLEPRLPPYGAEREHFQLHKLFTIVTNPS